MDATQRYVYVNGVRYDMKWGDPTVDEDADGVVGIRSYTEGYEGTKNLIIKRKDQPNFADTYSLFNWIYNEKNQGNVDGIWQLPAYNEAILVRQLKDVLNPKIVAAGGVEILNARMWVSTEINQLEAGFIDGALTTTGKDIKNVVTWSHSAIAIAKF